MINTLKVFGGTSCPDLTASICEYLEVPAGLAKVEMFPDGEKFIKLEEDVRGKDCFVVLSTCAPVDINLMELLIFLDCLRRASARRITAVIPYFGYARQDRKDEGRVGVSCLLNEAPLQTEIFVKYHLALGIRRIRLYFDNPQDPMLNHDFGTDRVEAIACSDDFWNEVLGRMPANNAEKLSVCHKHGLNYLNKLGDIDWVINLDADELLYVKPGASLASYLPSVMSMHLQVQARPLESVFVDEAGRFARFGASATYIGFAQLLEVNCCAELYQFTFCRPGPAGWQLGQRRPRHFEGEVIQFTGRLHFRITIQYAFNESRSRTRHT